MILKKYIYSPFFYVFLLIVGYFTFTKIIDGDFGFHLMQGKYFFENHWQLPLKEIYSYTIAGQTNIILSWLFDVWIYFIYAKMGFFGLSLWKSTVFVLLGILFILRLENLAEDRSLLCPCFAKATPGEQGFGRLNQWLVYGFTFLFLAAVFGRVNMERPHALGYIYFSLFLLLVDSFLRKPPHQARGFYWFAFAFLQLLWVNAHSSFMAGLIILAIFIFGLILEYFCKKPFAFASRLRPSTTLPSASLRAGGAGSGQAQGKKQEDLEKIISQIKKLSLLFILLALVSIINPYGWEIVINFFKASPSGGSRIFIKELWPMQGRDFFSLLGFFWFLSLIPLIKFWRGRPACNASHSDAGRDFKMVLTFLAFAFLGITSTRFSYDYVILTAPFSVIEVLGLAYKQASPLRPRPTSPLAKSKAGGSPAPRPFGNIPKRAGQGWRGWAGARDLSACIGIIVTTLIFGLIFIFTANKQEHGSGLSVNKFPIRSADFVLQNKIQGRMFNTFNIGSYLIWHLYPQYQVFIDTRAQNYEEGSKDSFLWNYFKSLRDTVVWQKLDEKYNFDFAVAEWPYILNKKISNSTERNFTSDKWALVFMDSQGLVYLKRTEANKELIEKYEYKYIKPQHIDSKYLNDYVQNSADWSAAVKEFQRAIEEAPDSYRAHFFYTDLLARNPNSDVKEIIYHLQKTIELNPRFTKAKDILEILTKGKQKI